jgi:hypothetical protein
MTIISAHQIKKMRLGLRNACSFRHMYSKGSLTGNKTEKN